MTLRPQILHFDTLYLLYFNIGRHIIKENLDFQCKMTYKWPKNTQISQIQLISRTKVQIWQIKKALCTGPISTQY